MADDEQEQWRTITFSYRVPDGFDWEAREDEMIDALAVAVGCKCDGSDTPCAATWAGSAGPLKEEDE